MIKIFFCSRYLEQSPPGYAIDVMDTCKETGLPRPSAFEPAQDFQPGHSDYKKIITNIKKFTETVG